MRLTLTGPLLSTRDGQSCHYRTLAHFYANGLADADFGPPELAGFKRLVGIKAEVGDAA